MEWWVFFSRCRHSTMNIATFTHFLPIIIISGRRLLCSSTMTIMFTLVVSSRLCLIIRWLMLSTRLPIMIWFYFTEAICLQNFYISANEWKLSTDLWPRTNNYNIFIFKSWFLDIPINIFGRIQCTVKCHFLMLLLYLDILKHNYFDYWQWTKKQN